MIYLDMDGVVANFNEQYLLYCNSDHHHLDLPLQLGEHFYSQDISKFYDQISKWGEDFWSEMNLFRWSKSLVDFSHKYGFRFLSSPVWSCPQSYSGKILWVKKHFPDHVNKVLLVPAKDKVLLAKTPLDILIDDKLDTVDNWTKRGGKGFWFNTHKAYEDKNYIRNLFRDIEEYVSSKIKLYEVPICENTRKPST